MSIFGAEAIGTALLILLGNGVVAGVLLNHSKAQNAGWIVITWGWGMAVMVAVFAVGQFSGAHLNPAVTFGFAIEGTTKWSDVPEYLAGEFVGAFIGATLVWIAYLDHWARDRGSRAQARVLQHGAGDPQPGLQPDLTEIIGTFVLVFGVLAFFANKATAATGLGGLLVGLLVLVIGLSLGGPTGYAINPARDLGPRIIHAILPIAGKGGSDWGYAWVPVVAPLIGGGDRGGAFYEFYPG